MDTQKILKPAKLAVIADYREREVISCLKNLGLSVNEMSLEVGDFVCSDSRVAIERKAHSDFVSSIIDGRLFEQARNMKENFEKPVIIIEGYSDRQINENALKAAVASLVVDYGISIVSTKNLLDTAKTIYWIVKKEQEENKKLLSFKVGKKPKDDGELKEHVVSSLPGVSNKTAKKILENFKSIRDFMGSDKSELEKVLGKKKAERIFNLINKN